MMCNQSRRCAHCTDFVAYLTFISNKTITSSVYDMVKKPEAATRISGTRSKVLCIAVYWVMDGHLLGDQRSAHLTPLCGSSQTLSSLYRRVFKLFINSHNISP